MRKITFHLLANAHLDPVWLWDWREGLNEAIVTVRTILDLMDENPDLTFMRGEAVLYRHIEEHDPETFARIKRYVATGRWDVVGGTYVQPDMNLPATETFLRHFLRSQRYFQARFGRTVRVGWAADAFGHSAGLPGILTAAGLTGFAFNRPLPDILPLSKPLFWWEGAGGARILTYRVPLGYYCCERDAMPRQLDDFLKASVEWGLDNVGIFYGLGNHGGGPSRRNIQDIRQWIKAHPEVNVVFSTLHRLFAAWRREVARKGRNFLPVHRGELNFCLRGCYASVAKLKFAYRQTEARVARAERINAVINAALGQKAYDLEPAWDAVLFNSFHDILPGTSIERAYEDQLAWLGGARHASHCAELQALNRLAAAVDTRLTVQPPADHPCAAVWLVFNPHPYEYRGPLEIEASLEYRPIWAYNGRADALPVEVRGPDGKQLPFQAVATEQTGMRELPMRRRVVVPVTLPAMGWSVLEMAWVEGAQAPQVSSAVAAPRPGVIENGIYRVAAAQGGRGIRVFRRNKPVFGAPGLSAITVEDPWGAWGATDEDPQSLDLSAIREHWKITDVRTLETGPQRASLWVRLEAGRSWLELTFFLYRQRDAVDVVARVLWNERAARLKLVMPAGDRAEVEVPGGVARRGPVGEVPGGRWVRVRGPRGNFGFASNALYGFDCKQGALRATVVRATHYSKDEKTAPEAQPWLPAVDAGELKFSFVLTPGDRHLARLAYELEQPPVAILVPPRGGRWPRSGSLALLQAQSGLRILALTPCRNQPGWLLCAQETAGRAAKACLQWLGRPLDLGPVHAWEIAAWRLNRTSDGWRVRRVTLLDGLANHK